MKFTHTLLSALCLAMLPGLATPAMSEDNLVSGIYVGGHIRRERPGTITKLRESGFTYALLFNVHVDSDGTLMTDGETICKNGQYVFVAEEKPVVARVEDIRLLKTPPTSISRIEIVIGGWGNDSYNHIQSLINKNGTGRTTMLYRNFKALLEAVPGIDAVNNDDEQCYDVSTATKFHVMMYDLGCKTTLAPYTYQPGHEHQQGTPRGCGPRDGAVLRRRSIQQSQHMELPWHHTTRRTSLLSRRLELHEIHRQTGRMETVGRSHRSLHVGI